ncbi:MAG: hypothetical protein R2709_15140 [Marmoricola sp.]
MARRPLIPQHHDRRCGAWELPAIVSLRDLAKNPDVNLLRTTVWKKECAWSKMSMDVDQARRHAGRPAGQRWASIFFENTEGENYREKGGHRFSTAKSKMRKAKAAVILVRMNPDDIKAAKDRDNWGVEGICAIRRSAPTSAVRSRCGNSKLITCCAHVTSPTFDLADNGRVVFGPAARALPSYPSSWIQKAIWSRKATFTEPVGPSFWERG